MTRGRKIGERAILWGAKSDRIAFMCPGCDEQHVCSVGTDLDRPRWAWNGDLDRPTLQPSVFIKTGRAVDPNYQPEPDDPPEICHSFVVDGRIQFLGDCTHALAGQSVDLPAPERHQS
jgi:hypothetical protein